MFKVFGCLAYAYTIDHGSHKFDPQGRRCDYLGNSLVSKGNILLDYLTQEIFVSRDVIFLERFFPFHSLSSPVVPSPPLVPFIPPFDPNPLFPIASPPIDSPSL